MKFVIPDVFRYSPKVKFIMLKLVPDDYAVRLEAISIAVHPAIERLYFFFASFAPLR
jgi:hypothetical protein